MLVIIRDRLTGGKKNHKKFNMYTSHIHGKDPGKRSNLPKWLKAPPEIPSQLKTKDIGGGDSLTGGTLEKHSKQG